MRLPSLRALAPLAAGLLACAGTAHSAPSAEDFQTWAAITATGGLGSIDPKLDSFRYWLEGQGRFGNDTSMLSQGMLRAGAGYALDSRASVWLGYAFAPTMEPFAADPVNEQRLWQQFLWTDKTALGTFSSRTRFEQRFIGQPDVSYRFRQLFKLSYPLPFAADFSLVGWDEIFVHLNNTGAVVAGLDQNRVFAGLGYNFDAHLRTEFGYMNQYIQKSGGADRISHVLSLSLFLNY